MNEDGKEKSLAVKIDTANDNFLKLISTHLQDNYLCFVSDKTEQAKILLALSNDYTVLP